MVFGGGLTTAAEWMVWRAKETVVMIMMLAEVIVVLVVLVNVLGLVRS